MRAEDRRVYRWVRGPTEHAGYHVHKDDDDDGRAAGSVGEALRWTAEYWQRVWRRVTANIDKAVEFGR